MRRWIAAALLACLAGPAAAQAPEPASPVLEVRLLPGWRGDGGAQVAALEIRLAPGWHTYWRAPGANGIPPQFDWSGSTNLAGVGYDWPRPIVFDSFGGATIGYKERLVLPLRLAPVRPGAPIDADLALFFGVCRDICVPAEVRLAHRFEPDAPPANRAPIEAALASGPVSAAAAGVRSARCALGADAEGGVVVAEIALAQAPSADVVAVIEAPSRADLWIGAAETVADGGRVSARAALRSADGGPALLDRGALRVTLIDREAVVEIDGCG